MVELNDDGNPMAEDANGDSDRRVLLDLMGKAGSDLNACTLGHRCVVHMVCGSHGVLGTGKPAS
jgi:hypothetical protein